MSYKLEKPYTDKQRADFIVKYNHNQGLQIEETGIALYALGSDEIMQSGQPVKNPNYETEELKKEKERKVTELNTAKEAAFKQGVTFKGSLFDCDDRAQDRTGNRLLLLNAVPEEALVWLDYSYKEVQLSAREFQELCSIIFERVQFIEFKTGMFLDAIEKASTIEELSEIVIEFNEGDDQNDV